MTREEKLKQSLALSNAMRLRPNYIGDIKDECPRLFNSWRGILYTKKGKRAGCVEEWQDFRTFYECVRPGYLPGLVLRRKDVYLPWGPDNYIWVTTKEAGVMKDSIYIEYNGKTQSASEWASELGLSAAGIKNRYYRRIRENLTTEQVLFGRRCHRGTKHAKDINEQGVIIRSKASKMISSYRHKDKENRLSVCDLTIEWLIDNILTKPCAYCGDTKRIGCDRIDNNRGHTRDNVVPCCIECNTARNNFFSYEEMRILGRTIAKIKKQRKEEIV